MKGPHPERLELWHSGVTFLPFLWPQAQVTCSCLIWGSPLYQHRKNKVVVATITQFSQGIIFKLLLIWSGFGILSFFFSCHFSSLLWLSVLPGTPIWCWCEFFVFHGMTLCRDIKYTTVHRDQRGYQRQNCRVANDAELFSDPSHI